MRISEIFHSVQGEGLLLGTPSVFIRTSGCNLRCRWCDTPYTSWRPAGAEKSIRRILETVRAFDCRFVVVTGGEPLLAPALTELTQALKKQGAHLTLETAGTLYRPVACDLISLSPKLSNSTPWRKAGGRFAGMHEQRRLNLPALRSFMRDYDYQLKFVVDRPGDFSEIADLLDRIPSADRSRVMIMAQGTTPAAVRAKASWIVESCKQFGYRYTPRLHIDLYGNRRGR